MSAEKGTANAALIFQSTLIVGALCPSSIWPSIARLTRSAVLEVMRQDYIRTARAKGLNDVAVLLRHNLKNAAIPVVTIMGLQFGTLLGGAVVTETVFSWPGIGLLAIKSIGSRDYPIVQSSVLLVAIAFVFVNFLVDLAYAWLDPRIHYR